MTQRDATVNSHETLPIIMLANLMSMISNTPTPRVSAPQQLSELRRRLQT
jgi:hypothetical protein